MAKSSTLMTDLFSRKNGDLIPGTIFKGGDTSDHRCTSNTGKKSTLSWSIGAGLSMLRLKTTSVGWAVDEMVDEEGIYIECANSAGDKTYQLFAAIEGDTVNFRHMCSGWEPPSGTPYLCHHVFAALAMAVLREDPEGEFGRAFAGLTTDPAGEIGKLDEPGFFTAADALYFMAKAKDIQPSQLNTAASIKGVKVIEDLTKQWFGRNGTFTMAEVDKAASVPKAARGSFTKKTFSKEDFTIERVIVDDDLEKLVIKSTKYVVTDEHREMARRIKMGVVKNLALVGDSGTGKSVFAEILGHLSGLPTVQYSFSGGVREADIAGGFGPNANFGKPLIIRKPVAVVEAAVPEAPAFSEEELEALVSKAMEMLDADESFGAITAFLAEGINKDMTDEEREKLQAKAKQVMKSSGAEKAFETFAELAVKTIKPPEPEVLPEPEPEPEDETPVEKDDREFLYIEGMFAKAVRHGMMFIAEELNMAYAEVLAMFNGPLEGKPLILKTGEVVKPHPNFRFIATMNIGDGYEGTKALNVSLLGRFHRFVELNAIPDEVQIEIIKNETGIDGGIAKKIVKAMNMIRAQMKETFVTDGVASIRQAIKWAEEIQLFKTDPREAAIPTVINYCSLEQADFRQKMADRIKEIFA